MWDCTKQIGNFLWPRETIYTTTWKRIRNHDQCTHSYKEQPKKTRYPKNNRAYQYFLCHSPSIQFDSRVHRPSPCPSSQGRVTHAGHTGIYAMSADQTPDNARLAPMIAQFIDLPSVAAPLVVDAGAELVVVEGTVLASTIPPSTVVPDVLAGAFLAADM
jgi:hypothetical protein